MQAKIEWYQEVLELEPGSKVFFPLARLLGQSGRADEAVRVLRQGLERHPEYTEARLLLVQLLGDAGDADACKAELVTLTPLFAAYPGFWQAWSEHSASEDQAWGLRFLAACFRDPSFSLRDVLFGGLQAHASGAAAGAFPSAVPVMTPVEERAAADPASAVPEVAELAASLQQPASGAESMAGTSALPEEEEDVEEPTVRTRSMADVLAEQGDVQSALDIYHEILERTPPGPEADVLRQRIASLSGVEASVPVADAEVSPMESAEPAASDEQSAEPNKMRSMLESLAQRLDARAQ